MKPSRPKIRKGGTYPQEFREEAVRYWLSSGQTLKSVASDLGVTPDCLRMCACGCVPADVCLRMWHRQMEVTPLTTAPDQTAELTPAQTSPHAKELALARELGQLRRELEAMTRQRDILKKAITIFSEDKTLGGGST